MKNKQCKQCHKSFQVTDKDLEFYNRIKIDPPKNCPDCRKQKRLAYKNDFNLNQAKCDSCQKSMITMYDTNSEYKIYCKDCWFSDTWDAESHSTEFDFNMSFFQQFNNLKIKVPRVALSNNQAENSDFCNFTDRNKNCYLISTANDNEDCMYGYWLVGNKNCLDISHSIDCENCYELVDCKNCYQVLYSQLAFDCTDCKYLFDCRGCNNCIGCTGLRNCSYYIFNKAYSKQDYYKKIKSLYTKNIIKNFLELKIKYPHKYFIGKNIENSTGDRLYNCQNVINSFDVHGGQNCAYLQDGLNVKDCYDCYGFDDLEFSCECLSAIGYGYVFSYYCRDCYNILYCDSCHNCKNCFGCVGLRNKENYIFNKKYNLESFSKLKAKIIEYMKTTSEWSESFPVKFSPFAYNQTLAQNYYSLTRQECLAHGWKWQDNEKKQNKTERNISVCNQCNSNFKIIDQEQKFYDQNNIKKPKSCFLCRQQARLNLRNPSNLWRRQCDCTQINHGHHGRCQAEFETTYSPERKELVYCEQCYKQNIY